MAVFWISILIAVIFAYSTIKLGFYHAWTMLFNLLVAVYIAIRIGPFLEDFFPAAVNGQYGKTISLLAAGTGTFLILQGIAYVLLIGQFEVTFPRTVNIIGSGLMGFMAGFLVCSFATFIFCTTPFSQQQYVKEIGLDTKTFEEAKMQSYLVGCCKFMDTFVASGNDTVGAEKTIKELLMKPVNNAVADANARGGLNRAINANEPNNRMNPASVRTAPEPNNIIPP
ncbi:MAG: CvpA family protein [Sedimentisphaerales bacterium]|jgi:ABC-type xylose transport system permease subunit